VVLAGQVRLEVRNYPGMNEAYNRALAISMRTRMISRGIGLQPGELFTMRA